ncbi:hypothetical protein midi_01084 [Candidatus Midichloria mitochondrii IricVA]|uniref:Uncharacterized protein n=1 Tax=Midichloria mitochondrii (strain IricVA) TaxID=696127 RepID=F7XU02_MIDMI|nr:hypothetical protein midi_01084 [Candidatus Midichloria mitochondrii IricVA]
MKIFGCYGFQSVSLIVLIPHSSRLGFRSIIHSVFLSLITFSVILFAILVPVLPLAVHNVPHHSSPAREPQYLHLIVISTPVLLRRYHTILLPSIITRQCLK